MIWLGCAPWWSSERSTAGTIALRQGGRTPGIDAETAKKLIRKDDDVEPVFYWCYPYQFHEDILRGLSARLIVSLTIGDGSMALASLLLEKPFVGVALTPEHRAGVRTHLANCVFLGFMTEGSPFYDARIAQELHDAGVTKTNVIPESGGGAPTPTPKAKSGGAPTPKSGGAPAPTPKAKSGGAPAPTPKTKAKAKSLPTPPPPKKRIAEAKSKPAAKKAKAVSIADKMKHALAALGEQDLGDEGDDVDDPNLDGEGDVNNDGESCVE